MLETVSTVFRPKLASGVAALVPRNLRSWTAPANHASPEMRAASSWPNAGAREPCHPLWQMAATVGQALCQALCQPPG